MALTDAARTIIQNQLDQGNKSGKNTVVYSVETGLLDSSRDGTVAKMSFKFSKPVSQDLIDVRTSNILRLVSTSLNMEGDIAGIENMLQEVAGKRSRVGKKRSTGRVNVSFGDPVDEQGFEGSLTGASGRFVSNSNMRQLLELLAKEYLIRDMKKAGAPLKFRTGRFANSLKIRRAAIMDRESKRGNAPELDISYTYMTRPYSVFNPAVSTYRRLSLRPFAGARNPQKLIGEAIAKATRDLLHSRYKIKVQQGI
ncbi:hypothetical protein P13BB106kb_p118 [Pectobacterium phage DU_PP_V]|uniref:Tail completion protein n=1 Tax=Pectobacterium phage DU_PP_V TaxID=2041492 RepID=A0A2D2W728_9CAUD|nr:tail completion or Neck1 protein [Pectobacterium phage DU_PP_V]ATS94102.1 hypothetical protein P13BB106kb_p118 [Pectobacterium phage DU_PP_V]